MQGYEEFKKDIYNFTGLDLSLYKEKQMRRRLESRMTRLGKNSYKELFQLLKTDKAAFDDFMNYLTINVSEFFRNPEQWEKLEKKVLPKLIRKSPNLKVWSAACSTGEEPYSLVMLLTRFFPTSKIKILAADIDDEAIKKAKLGLYREKSLENIPKDLKEKYFEKVGMSYKISDEIKSCVEFKKMNLLSDKYPVGFDLIVCRNVMIYFTDEAKDLMYQKFNDSLKDGGVLFVGSTEQIISPARYRFSSEETFFYTKYM